MEGEIRDDNRSIWKRIGNFLEVLDAAFDPASADRQRVRSLEARVRQLESERDAVNSDD
jgi:hypothetical protein